MKQQNEGRFDTQHEVKINQETLENQDSSRDQAQPDMQKSLFGVQVYSSTQSESQP